MTTKKVQTQNLASQRPALRFPDFLNDGEWEVKRLGEIAEFYKGKGIPKSEASDKGKTPCVRYGELYTHYKEVIDEAQSFTDIPTEELFLSKANDVIIPSSGETKEDISTASCVLKDNIALGGDINVIRTPHNGVFLSYYLNNAKKDDIAKIAQGVSIIHLYNDQLKNLRITLPSIEEQNKIADCLTALDELIAATNEKLEQMKVYKKGLMQKLFPAKGKKLPELRFKEFEKDGEWEVKKLGDIFSLIRNGAMYNTNNTSGFPMSRIETISNGVIDYDRVGYSETELKDYRLNEGDILFSHINSLAHIGKVAYYDGSKVLYHGMNLLVLRCEMSFYPLYIFYLLNTEEMKIALRSIAKRAINQASISTKELAQLLVYIPQKEEQRKIADCFTSIDEMINQYTNKVSFLEVYKKGLMQQMFPHVETQNFASLPTDKQM